MVRSSCIACFVSKMRGRRLPSRHGERICSETYTGSGQSSVSTALAPRSAFLRNATFTMTNQSAVSPTPTSQTIFSTCPTVTPSAALLSASKAAVCSVCGAPALGICVISCTFCACAGRFCVWTGWSCTVCTGGSAGAACCVCAAPIGCCIKVCTACSGFSLMLLRLKDAVPNCTGTSSRTATVSQSAYCRRRLIFPRRNFRSAISTRISTLEEIKICIISFPPPLSVRSRTARRCRCGSGRSVLPSR